MTTVAARLERTTFATSRLLDFCSEKELTAQTGHDSEDWPRVVVKELIDNAIDACEEAGTQPVVHIELADDRIVVVDNGPGIPAAVIDRVLDFSVRVSSREAYVSPTRGAQGNALKTLVAMPFVLDGKSGTVEIDSLGIKHTIVFAVDPIRQAPVIDVSRSEGVVRTGTRVTVHWPSRACSLLVETEAGILQLAETYAWLNPHLALSVDSIIGDEQYEWEPSAIDWPKWRPSDPTSPHWYTAKHLERLITGYIAHDRASGRSRTVRELITEFRGLSGTAKQKRVLEESSLWRAPLEDLVNCTGLDHTAVERLLAAMQANSAEVKPEALGIIGRDHLAAHLEVYDGDMESLAYKRIANVTDGVPWVVEAAFCSRSEDCRRKLVLGINWAAAIGNPFRTLGYGYDGLTSLLTQQRAGPGEPVGIALHLAWARAAYTDRGKTAAALPAEIQGAVAQAIEAVTAKWAKQRRAEERDRNARLRRADAIKAMQTPRKRTLKSVAYEVMEQAYLKASANNTLPAKARQIMYAARPLILEQIEKDTFSDSHFTGTLLPDFVTENPELTADWKVIYDARGNLVEPHTGHSIGLGTTEVAEYLQGLADPTWSDPSGAMPEIRTHGPSGRYGAMLFVEKEGFNELFDAVHLAERYDLAIMSTKGVSNVAARQLIDKVSARYSIPVFVLHDFDVTGITILNTLRSDTRRYSFTNKIEVIDLGVRLADVKAFDLDSEPGKWRGSWETVSNTLRRGSASEDEVDYLRTRRVELNAFASDQLVEWIEQKLAEQGVKKVVPPAEILAEAYRREMQSRYLRSRFDALLAEARGATAGDVVPDNLADRVEHTLRDNPRMAWNDAISEIAIFRDIRDAFE